MLTVGDVNALRDAAVLSLPPLCIESVASDAAAARVWRWIDTAAHGRAGISPMLMATPDVRFVTQTTT